MNLVPFWIFSNIYSFEIRKKVSRLIVYCFLKLYSVGVEVSYLDFL